MLVIGPLVTFALPLIAMVAFWWNDWPGTRLRAEWSGWADTALLPVVLDAVAAIPHLTRAGSDDWVGHASLNALSTSIILHVAIGRRRPFASRKTLSENGNGKE